MIRLFFIGITLVVFVSGCADADPKAAEQKVSKWAQDIIQKIPISTNDIDQVFKDAQKISGDKIKWDILKDELLDSVTFESVNGFYDSHSPMRRKTGLMPLDDLLIAAKKLRDTPLHPSKDVDDALKQIIENSLQHQFKTYGFSEPQIIEIFESR